MIKYALICKDCNKEFESWFGSSKEYDRLKKMKLLNCQNCSSLNVEKSLMAPNLSKTKKLSEHNEFKIKEVKQKKGIYGKASIEDVRELKDEGIETEMIPWIEDKEN